MRKFSFFTVLTLLFCLCGCSPSASDNVYRYYAEGKYETTLTENNRYTLTDADTAITMAKAPEPVMILIGGAWCPYCAADVGVIDEIFRASAISETLNTIYYIDAADSQISASAIMRFNEEFDNTVQTTVPCLMLYCNGVLLAERNSPEFKQTDDRTEQIRLFFAYAEECVFSARHFQNL